MKNETLRDLLVDQLRDVYHAENQLLDALPEMIEQSSSPRLKSALEEHRGQTQTHVNRLEQAFTSMGEKVKGKKCAAMKGLISEGDDLLSDANEPTVRDAAVIAAAQKVEHYEIATYGTLATWANLLGLSAVADLLKQTLNEEKNADQTLSAIAETGINVGASAPPAS